MNWEPYIIASSISLDTNTREIIFELSKIIPTLKTQPTNKIKKVLIELGYEKGHCVYANLSRSTSRNPKIKESQNMQIASWLDEIDKKVEEAKKKYDYFGAHTFKNTEWLYDIHWYNDKRNTKYQPEHLYLVAECEFQSIRKEHKESEGKQYSGIKYDFQKLLVTNAYLRLLIFKLSSTNELNDECETSLSKYFHIIYNFSGIYGITFYLYYREFIKPKS